MLVFFVGFFFFLVLCGFQSKCELFPGKAYFEFIIKRDLKFADVPLLEAGQPRTANLVLYPIRVKTFGEFLPRILYSQITH